MEPFDEVEECLNETRQTVKTAIQEGEIDYNLYVNDIDAHWDAKDRAYLAKKKRQALIINKITPLIRALTGYEKRNRKAITVKPITEDDLPIAQQYSKIIASILGEMGYSTLSDIFATSVKTGISYAAIFPSYEKDPLDGDIVLTRVPFQNIVFDPTIQRKDFSDCDYLIREELFTLDTAKMLFPNKADDIERASKNQSILTSHIDNLTRPRVYLVEFWKREYKPVDFVVDPQTGMLTQWQGTNKLLKELKKETGMITIKKVVPVLSYSIFCNKTLLYKTTNPYGHADYPYIPFFCYFDPEVKNWEYKLQGIIRALRDPQKQINKSRSQFLDILATQIHTGIITETDAVQNPEVLKEAGQGKVIEVRPGARWEQIQSPRMPIEFLNLAEIYKADMQYTSNIHEDMLGLPIKGNEPAILHQVRTAQALTALQEVFDNYILGKKLVGKQLVKLIQKIFSPQKVIRMIGEQPAPRFYDIDVSQSDIQIAEAIITDTQRNLYFRELMDLRQAGFDIPLQWVLRYMDLPDKEQFIKFIEKQQGIALQEQRKQQQMTILGALSEAKLNLAKAMKELAKAQVLPHEAITKRVAKWGLSRR